MTKGSDSRGFTLIEALVSATLMMVVVGAVFTLVASSRNAFHGQPAAADVQQRLRVSVDVLTADLREAGAGPQRGASGGSLLDLLAPVYPYRLGGSPNDPAQGVFFRNDTITVVYALDTLPAAGDEDLYVARDGSLAVALAGSGGWVRVVGRTYYLRTDTASGTYQLRRFDGIETDAPVVDHVVGLAFEYFGEALPPRILDPPSLDEEGRPAATYGPRPPAIGDDRPGDEWGAGENCTFANDGAVHLPRLPPLGASTVQVPLTASLLTDGPWCPTVAAPQRYDADLLRVRRVRVSIRLQAAAAAMRGPAGVLFTRAGTSRSMQRFIPDHAIRFDVSPRNVNLAP